MDPPGTWKQLPGSTRFTPNILGTEQTYLNLKKINIENVKDVNDFNKSQFLGTCRPLRITLTSHLKDLDLSFPHMYF